MKYVTYFGILFIEFLPDLLEDQNTLKQSIRRFHGIAWKMASRLVQLASERQVIVFTRNIVFLADLERYCKAQDAPLRQSCLYRGPNHPGECIDGVPWAAMKVNSRIGYLKNWFQTAETTHRRQGPEAYEPESRRIYERLREAWKRAVE